MKYKFYHGIVSQILFETQTVRRFFIKIPELNTYDFRAGQFTMLDLPIQSKVTTRAYSIASAPNGDNEVELVIVKKDGGLGTNYLFEEIMVGSEIKISEPIGKFTCPRTDSLGLPLVFVCTGTGIAPFRSMILDILNHKAPFRNIFLIMGCRTQKDILFDAEMSELAAKIPTFSFIPVLSRPENDTWQGQRGYVHPVYLQIVNRFPESIVYLCGWKAMVNEARTNLANAGIQKEKIRFELYD